MAAPYNPRRMGPKQLARLRRSIRSDGFLVNLVCNRRSGRIISGHQRVRAASEEGLATLPVYWVDVDEPTEKRLNVSLNAIAGDFVEDALGAILSDLDSAAADLTGFDAREIARLVGLADVEAAAIDTGPTPAPAVNRSVQAVLTMRPEVAEAAAFVAALDTLCADHGIAYRFQKGS